MKIPSFRREPGCKVCLYLLSLALNNRWMGRHSVPVFHGLELLQDVIKTTEFMLAGINALWARRTLILARTVRRGLKLALRRAQIY